jgi:hypothetical protein
VVIADDVILALSLMSLGDDSDTSMRPRTWAFVQSSQKKSSWLQSQSVSEARGSAQELNHTGGEPGTRRTASGAQRAEEPIKAAVMETRSGRSGGHILKGPLECTRAEKSQYVRQSELSKGTSEWLCEGINASQRGYCR